MQPSYEQAISPGTLVHGRYRVTRIVGRGGMGAVYEAVDQRLGNTVALKQMLVSGPGVASAFEREARILAGLRHAALPRVTDYFGEELGQFLVMEFIPGNDLSSVMAQHGRPLPPEEVLRWADQILSALEYLHLQQPPIIHRDIKPQNIKLTPTGEIILLDFGLAKGVSSAQTQTSSIVAYTPTYAPVEQVQGSGTTPASDIYALSATLHHLLTGTPPPDVLQRLAARAHGQADPLTPVDQLNPLLPPTIARWLLQGLSLDPTQRYPSATAMRNARNALHTSVPPAALGTTLVAAPPGGAATGTPPRNVPPPPAPVYAAPTATSANPTREAPQRTGIPLWLILAGIVVSVGMLILAGGILLLLSRQEPAIAVPAPVITAPANSDQRASPTAQLPPLQDPAPPLPLPPLDAPPPGAPDSNLSSIPEPVFGPLRAQTPLQVSASAAGEPGFDAAGNRTTFEAANVADGRADTAWRVAGNGQGQFVQLDFADPVRIHELQVIPGYAKIDPFDGSDRFLQNRRVLGARIEFSDGTSYNVTFTDSRALQAITLPVPIVSSYVRLVVLETTPLPNDPNSRDFTPISEFVVIGEAQLP
jgi:hypothetical protein